MLQPEKWWQRSNGMSVVYKSEQFLLTGVMQTTWHKIKTVLPLTLSPLLSNLQLRIPILIYFWQDSWECPSWSTKPRFSAEWARTRRISKCCAIHCLSTLLHNSSSQLLSSCRAIFAFATNPLYYGSNMSSPWSVERSRQHENGSSGHSKIVPFLAGWWAPWQKCWSEAEGRLMAQKAGGGREGRGRASICAQWRLQRQQILAEQGACTEEKEMGERPNAQFGIKKKREESAAYGEEK